MQQISQSLLIFGFFHCSVIEYRNFVHVEIFSSGKIMDKFFCKFIDEKLGNTEDSQRVHSPSTLLQQHTYASFTVLVYVWYLSLSSQQLHPKIPHVKNNATINFVAQNTFIKKHEGKKFWTNYLELKFMKMKIEQITIGI